MKRNGRLERGSPLAQQPNVRRWRDIERYMDRSRDLRAATLAALLAGALGWARRALSWNRIRNAAAAQRALLMIGLAAFAGLLAQAHDAFAQEATEMSAPANRDESSSDRAVLTEFGVELTSIEQCEDADLLWRAVRELVLPQRVSESIQQRILRRTWVLDPDIAKGSLLDSETN